MHRSKLAWVLLFALAGLLVANTLSDWLRIDLYRPRSGAWNPYVFSYQQSDLTADIIFLGDSTVRWGIRTDLVETLLAARGLKHVRAVSAALPSSTVVRDATLLRELISSNGCPGIVVVEVCPRSLSRNSQWWLLLEDYVSLPDVPLILPAVRTPKQLDALLSAPLGGLTRLYDYTFHPPSPTFLAERQTRWYTEPRWRRRRRRNLPQPRYQLGGITERSLDQIGRLAVRCDADLLLVRMPIRRLVDGRPLAPANTYLERDVRIFAAESGATFVNYLQIDLPLSVDHFRDDVHLRRAGAALVSAHLVETVLGTLMQRHRIPESPVSDRPEPTG